MAFIDGILPVLYVFFWWWFSTGAVLFLNGLKRRTYPWTFAGATVLFVAAMVGVWDTAPLQTVSATYCAFSCGLLAWICNEVAFHFGYVTGPRRSVCPEDAYGWRRFCYGVQTLLYHELAILATLGAMIWMCWGQPNKFALWTFLLLWGMRLSTKFILFLGARNFAENFLPVHAEYLQTYFLRRPINFLFPFSVTISTALFTWLVLMAAHPESVRADTVGLIFLATLTGLAVIEHWFLVLPMPTDTLWKWGLRGREQNGENQKDEATQTNSGENAMSTDGTKPKVTGRIGPNSVIQVYRALKETAIDAEICRIFETADLARYLEALPEAMIPESEVIRLHRALRDVLPAARVDDVLRRAGETTADYLLANRIPRPVSAVLKRLPPDISAWVLLQAMFRHAWTFSGTGQFSWKGGRPLRLIIEDSPLCREEKGSASSVCLYYTATFEKMFKVLVSSKSQVRETTCGAKGDNACTFEITW